MRWTSAQIERERSAWGQAIEYDARLDDGSTVRALAYAPQVGRPRVGERVLLTSAALERRLGTGGYAMIVAIPERLPTERLEASGHVMKARYTPMQYMVQGVDEEESGHHHVLRQANSIARMPVIAADLHSALPAIVAGVQYAAKEARIAYVMTDGGALPAWFSKTAHQLTETGDILGTITAGQAYGGQLEAVNVYTALLAAKLVWHADVTIVTQGPGNLGTDTRWGFSGTSTGEVLNAAHTLDGQPIAAIRASEGDPRERHRGISHHTIRVLSDIVRVPCDVVVPELPEDSPVAPKISRQLSELSTRDHLRFTTIPIQGLDEVLRDPPAPLQTMGRSYQEDRLAFLAAAAAGVFAAQSLS
ncbi:hypothetical protein J2S70_000040 [Trueperella bonasi]|uniref:DUF3866 family protein n=1 Tax=Trueperella bonasi TaxID=312286 RepID=A0ABT9NF31_9ACTO|nr:DUF3866 family protein [Trueperella bonasi]MDP9805458.1 hypothetical protein [Trueperella bonasi]